MADTHRWCKSCKAAFAGLTCQAGHPNFSYAKDIPEGYDMAGAQDVLAPLSSKADSAAEASVATAKPPARTSSGERKMSVTLMALTEGAGGWGPDGAVGSLRGTMERGLSFDSPRTPRGLRSPKPAGPGTADTMAIHASVQRKGKFITKSLSVFVSSSVYFSVPLTDC